ncbi:MULTISPECIES: hypothetical protein [Micromonospora]|uniref:hypothetical protein n=1 Tax=Micromonospora TaxID=1873 RepID=UPI0001BF2EB0|nr:MULTISPECIES: hypothetical protein [Micromonospora]ADL49621.1 hypothetical protein Micau_6126 [Micromonospora aurantiaca ATCC 27029]
MYHASVAAALRYFPLLGRPRPDCPALPLRIKEIADAADTAVQKREHGMPDAAHALNKAALIASDAGMPDLARKLCWQHINAYRRTARPLSILEARYMLEPVLNLARLQIRADHGVPALRLLEAMYDAVTHRTALILDKHALPTATLDGDAGERRKLREWVWLQLLGEGIRILALSNRWAGAAEHARKHNGIGGHLMEGRQAAVIAACIQGKPDQGRKILGSSTLTQLWEHQVATCLNVICIGPADANATHHLTVATEQLAAPISAPNYASYRTRLGLATAILATPTRPKLAAEILYQTAQQAIDIADGYAARDVLSFCGPIGGTTPDQCADLRRITVGAGLAPGGLPETAVQEISRSAALAEAVVAKALHRADSGRASPENHQR